MFVADLLGKALCGYNASKPATEDQNLCHYD
jgi:hypothetical protein